MHDLNQIPCEYTVEVTDRFQGLYLIEFLKSYGQRLITLYRRRWPKPSQRKRNARRQNGCLRRPYKKKRREVKSKGERESYTQLNAGFQRIARRHMKAFLNEQSKEIEENNRTGEISSRKLEIQGNISCKDGHNKWQKWQGPNRSRRD